MKRVYQKSPRRTFRSGTAVNRNVSIIGAGRLGTALGTALQKAGYPVLLVVTKHPDSARRAASRIPGQPLGISKKQLRDASKAAQLLAQSSLILIATPDDVISEVAGDLARVLPRNPRPGKLKQTVLHTSGALSASELQPLKQMGLATGSLHPLVSISERASPARPFSKSFFCVEGDAKAVRVAARIARALGGRTFTVRAKDKPLYHAAAVMAAGNVIALFDLAVTMLRGCGLSRQKSRQVLLPLVKSSLANLETAGSSAALTGPLTRGDRETLEKHLKALAPNQYGLALDVYRILGLQSLISLESSAKQPSNADQLKKLLTVTRT